MSKLDTGITVAAIAALAWIAYKGIGLLPDWLKPDFMADGTGSISVPPLSATPGVVTAPPTFGTPPGSYVDPNSGEIKPPGWNYLFGDDPVNVVFTPNVPPILAPPVTPQPPSEWIPGLDIPGSLNPLLGIGTPVYVPDPEPVQTVGTGVPFVPAYSGQTPSDFSSSDTGTNDYFKDNPSPPAGDSYQLGLPGSCGSGTSRDTFRNGVYYGTTQVPCGLSDELAWFAAKFPAGTPVSYR